MQCSFVGTKRNLEILYTVDTIIVNEKFGSY